MIYILVPTFGRIDETKKFLESLENSIQKEYIVIIIDDHPEKVTYKNIKVTDKLKIITSENELWWVGSINLGIKIIFHDFKLDDNDLVIFANNDVQINKKSFELLYDELKNDKNQILHPRTFDQDGKEVSSGTKILSLFPYITIHPKSFDQNKIRIDMGTARFLCFSASILKKVGYITNSLVQYGGDNYFTLIAKKKYNINTYILRDAKCHLDDTNTGIKNMNINSLRKLYSSFFSVRSPNNIKYRYYLFKSIYNKFIAFFVVFSLTINTVLKYLVRKKFVNHEK
ncbi:MAG: glycosyltransferase family 2 protein [Candidatus Altimarinota bacterium]